MRILLDTNAYSDWRRTGMWNPTISTADVVFMPSVVLGELRYGFEGSAQVSQNEAKLRQFLKHPLVKLLTVGDATSRCYAALKFYLRKQGTPIPENDIWIAAMAVEHGLELVTSDRHFSHLPQVAKVIE